MGNDGRSISKGPYSAVEAFQDGVVAQVSLFSDFRYIESRSDVGFQVVVHLKKAHFFDIESRAVVEVEPPLVPRT